MSSTVKIILVVIGIILLGLLGYFLWSRFAAPTTPIQPATETALPSETTQEFGTLGTVGTSTSATSSTASDAVVLKKLSDGPVLAYWVLKSSNTAFYVTREGGVFQAKDDADTEITKQHIAGILTVEASPSGAKALVSFGDVGAPQWALFDTGDKVWRPLPKELVNVAWAGTEDKLFGIVSKDGTPALATINLSKNPYEIKTTVTNFLMRDISFVAKSSSEILLLERPSALTTSRTWQIDTKAGTMTLVTDATRGAFFRWSSDKTIAFRFIAPNKLSILDRSFSDISPLTFVTLPNKCDGGVDVAYCFIPTNRSLFSNTYSLPDDYFMNKIYTTDSLYRVDTHTGNISQVLASDPAQSLDADRVVQNNSSTYFINKYDNYLYMVQQPIQNTTTIYDY